ncbi:hemerythrin [Clostridioides difficile]|uniref:hemerythrin domain-containing protein n=1 Tax=unclassified Clostridioides TaxID=2635829 RepID=UPI0016B8838F|nr:hemerythrin [Clostridioides difficile]NJI79496.1 hemerythrin domain-containing protein [Clostridioides difficile]
MDAITLMIEEHKNIERMLKVIRRICLNILDGNSVDYNDFYKIIDFVKHYADKHHHEKEEKFLFTRMVDEIGGPAEKLVKFGMLVEHDLGRLYIKELDESLKKFLDGNKDARLDILANSMSYANLLSRHIDRENNVAYSFARRELCEETLCKINSECEIFEKDMENVGLQNKYIQMLELLEHKYM